jgi:hypothetical protein
LKRLPQITRSSPCNICLPLCCLSQHSHNIFNVN